jgi:hypothetical protein
MIGNLLRVTPNELENYLKKSSLLEDRIYADDFTDPNLLDLDKAWEGIFYLLNGFDYLNAEETALPIIWSFAVGNCIDPEQDLGYGPAYYLSVEEVKQLTLVLDKISSEAFRQRFITSNMQEEAGIYSDYEYLQEVFNSMKDFLIKASNDGQFIISFVN